MSILPTDEQFVWGGSQFLFCPEGSALLHYIFREQCFTALHVQGAVLYYTTCSGSSALLHYMFREQCSTTLHVQGVVLYCTTCPGDLYSNAGHVRAVGSKKKPVRPNSHKGKGIVCFAHHILGGSRGVLPHFSDANFI